MAKIKNTAFEVKVTDWKRNDTQNITGLFGYMVSTDFVEDDCSSGFLCVKQAKLDNEGYKEPFIRSGSGFAPASGIKNANSWQMIAAENGNSGGMYGDHTGIYACNTYDVNKAVGAGITVNIPGETLGLFTPAGERTDFTEMIVGEMYNFASGNFSVEPDEQKIYAVISNGLFVATDAAPTDGSVYFRNIPTEERFTRGVSDYGAKYTMLCQRAVTESTTKYTITATITNGSSTGDSSIDEEGTASVTITPDAGYVLPESVTVDGATSEYNSTTGVISLSNPTGNVTIAATCDVQEQGLTPFLVGQSVTAFDFGDVQNDETSEAMQAFLEGLTYGEDNMVILLSATAGEATATLRARMLGESTYALYAYMGDTGAPLYENGYKGLTDGKFAFGATATVETVNDTTPPTWNGVLVGAVEA